MSSSSKKRKGCIAALFVLTLFLGTLVLVTRSFFLTGVVLPAVSKSVGIEIRADELHLSSTVRIVGFEVNGLPDITRLEIPSAEIHPDWMRLIKGEIAFDLIQLDSPKLEISLPETESKKEASTETTSSPPPVVDIKEFQIINGQVRYHLKDEELLLIQDARLTLTDLGNDSELTLSGSFAAQHLDTATSEPLGHGTWNGDLKVGLSNALKPSSANGETSFTWKNDLPDLPEYTITLTPDLLMDLESQRLDLRQLSALALSGGTEQLSLHLSQPTSLDWSTQPLSIGDTSLTLLVNRTRLEDLPFSNLFPIKTGNIELTAQLTVTNSGTSLEAAVTGSADGLQGEIQGIPVENGSIALNTSASGNLEQISVSSLEVSLLNAGAPLAGITGSGTFSPTDGSGDVQLDQLQLDLGMFQSLLPESPRIDGLLNTSGRITRTSEGLVRFRAGANLRQNRSSVQSPLPLPIQLDLVGQVDLQSALIRSGQLTWPGDQQWENSLMFKGSADWSKPEAPQAELQIDAKGVDLNPWLGLLPAPEKPEEDSTPIPPQRGPLQLDPLPIGASSITLLAETLRYRDSIFKQVDLHVALGPTSLVLHPVSFQIFDSTFKSSSSIEWPESSPSFSITSSLTPLNVEPVFDSFFPESKGALKGVFSFDTSLEGTASTAAGLVETLKGSLQATMEQGQVRLFAPVPDAPQGLLQTQKLLESIIRALAQALAVPPEQLLDPPVEKISLKASIADQQVALETFQAENSEFRLKASGSLPLRSGNIGNSDVGDIPIALGVNTNIAKRIRIYREDRLEEDKIMLPPLVDVRGTLAEPVIDVRKRALAGLVITGVTERNSTGNEDVDKALSILGGFLSGEGPPPTPTPVPEQAP